jgi:hypothetical protein
LVFGLLSWITDGILEPVLTGSFSKQLVGVLDTIFKISGSITDSQKTNLKTLQNLKKCEKNWKTFQFTGWPKINFLSKKIVLF